MNFCPKTIFWAKIISDVNYFLTFKFVFDKKIHPNISFLQTMVPFRKYFTQKIDIFDPPPPMSHFCHLFSWTPSPFSIDIVNGAPFEPLHGHYKEQLALTPSSNSFWPNQSFFLPNYSTHSTTRFFL